MKKLVFLSLEFDCSALSQKSRVTLAARYDLKAEQQETSIKLAPLLLTEVSVLVKRTFA